jgi:2OG-Fe(II) oxygenase superfamily
MLAWISGVEEADPPVGVVAARWHSSAVPYFDVERLEGPPAAKLAQRYRLADPFPHVVLEDFVLPGFEEQVDAWTRSDWDGWTDRSSKFQPGKLSCRDVSAMPAVARGMIQELSEPRFLRALSNLTGIAQLLPDPFLEGGGLHCSGPGGKLTPHTDFHDHPHLKLFRRLNALIYLNPRWNPGHGGELGLFELGTDQPRVSVAPQYGTCVIFTTDHQSVHGVNPISEAAGARFSIALYYYTVEETDVFSGDRRTYWYEKPGRAADLTTVQRARLRAMRGSLRAAKLLTKVAYKIDPQSPDLV